MVFQRPILWMQSPPCPVTHVYPAERCCVTDNAKQEGVCWLPLWSLATRSRRPEAGKPCDNPEAAVIQRPRKEKPWDDMTRARHPAGPSCHPSTTWVTPARAQILQSGSKSACQPWANCRFVIKINDGCCLKTWSLGVAIYTAVDNRDVITTSRKKQLQSKHLVHPTRQ